MEVVRFRNIGFAKGGVVHVTAVTDQLAWCQAVSWKPSGGSEYVTVRCFVKGGVPMFVPFTVMFSASSGTLPGQLAYAYVHFATNVVSSYNSTGMANTVTAASIGRWVVRMHGAGPVTPSGGIQVTAVSAKPRICDVAGWTRTTTQQAITIACYGPSGKPAASGWNVSYQRTRSITGTKPRHFAYTWNNKPLIPGPYKPLPPGVNLNSAGGLNTVQRAGTGQSMLVFRRMAVLPNIIFVTGAALVARICNLNTVWATSLGTGQVIARDVNCYRPAGPLTPTQSFVSYDAKK